MTGDLEYDHIVDAMPTGEACAGCGFKTPCGRYLRDPDRWGLPPGFKNCWVCYYCASPNLGELRAPSALRIPREILERELALLLELFGLNEPDG